MADIENIKPISYFKANAAEMLQTLRETGAPYVITQNGEAAAVLVDAREYAKMERALELLRLLQMAEADVAAGRVVSVEEARAAVKYDRKKRDLKST
jgi:prevent-host-death family protein